MEDIPDAVFRCASLIQKIDILNLVQTVQEDIY